MEAKISQDPVGKVTLRRLLLLSIVFGNGLNVLWLSQMTQLTTLPVFFLALAALVACVLLPLGLLSTTVLLFALAQWPIVIALSVYGALVGISLIISYQLLVYLGVVHFQDWVFKKFAKAEGIAKKWNYSPFLTAFWLRINPIAPHAMANVLLVSLGLGRWQMVLGSLAASMLRASLLIALFRQIWLAVKAPSLQQLMGDHIPTVPWYITALLVLASTLGLAWPWIRKRLV